MLFALLFLPNMFFFVPVFVLFADVSRLVVCIRFFFVVIVIVIVIAILPNSARFPFPVALVKEIE